MSAPSCKVVAGGSVKASAVYEYFIFLGFEKVEILSLIIAPVEDARDDILFAYSDILYKTLPDFIGCRLYGV